MIKLMDLLLEVKLSPDEQEQYKQALAILKDDTLDEGIKDKLKKLGLSAAVIAALLASPQLTQAQKTPLQQLANQPTTTQTVATRTTTAIDGKLGSVTSRFLFPPAFLVYLNTGNVEKLGIEGNPELQRIASENKLTNDEMKSYNEFIKWLDNKGYKGSTKLDHTDFRLKVLNDYVKDHPDFFIDPSTADKDGSIEVVKKIQNILKIYRAFLIKQASQGESEITVGGKKLNLTSPNSPDWSLVPQFMSWAQ